MTTIIAVPVGRQNPSPYDDPVFAEIISFIGSLQQYASALANIRARLPSVDLLNEIVDNQGYAAAHNELIGYVNDVATVAADVRLTEAEFRIFINELFPETVQFFITDIVTVEIFGENLITAALEVSTDIQGLFFALFL